MIGLLGSETSEVVEADLAPLLGVFELMLQAGINLLPALFIDLGLGFVPDADEVFYLLDTTIVVILHLFEYSTSALHAISPGYAMEPQQITLRTGIDVVVERAIRLWILRGGIRTRMGAVETNTVVVGFVIIDGAPLQGQMGVIAIGLRTIMLVESEDMVETYGHHVVDTGFA